MRVLLVTHGFPPDAVAGVERYTQSVAKGLRDAGDEVAVLTRRPGLVPRQPRLERRREHDVDLYRVVGGTMSPETFLAHHRRLERQATRTVVEAAPDLVHVNHLVGIAPRVLQIARRLRIPTVVTLHDYYFACSLLYLRKRSGEACDGPDRGRECASTCFAGDPVPERWQTRTSYFERLLAYADLVTSASPHVAAYFDRHAPAAAPIEIMPHGVAVRADARPPAAPRASGLLRLAYFGSVTPEKGVETIIEAVALAALPAARLLVLGRARDGYARRLRELAARVPSLDLVVAGEYEREDLPRLLAETDAVVVPSRLPEVFPLAPREALAVGIPVIVSRLGGLPDAVDEGANGLTFDAARPDELAAIMRRLADNPATLERLRDGARRTPVLTAAEHVQALRERYEELIERSLASWDPKSATDAELDVLFDAMLRQGFTGGR